MVTGHLLAEPRLEGVFEHPDLPLNGKVPPLDDPIACGRRHRGLLHEGPGIAPSLHDLLQDVLQGGLLVTFEHDVAVLQTQFLQEGAHPLRRELVAGTFQRHDARQEVFRPELLCDENAPRPRVGGRAQEAIVNVHLWNLRVSVLFPVVDGPALSPFAVRAPGTIGQVGELVALHLFLTRQLRVLHLHGVPPASLRLRLSFELQSLVIPALAAPFRRDSTLP